MVSELINANPVVYEKKERRVRNSGPATDVDEYAAENIDQLEIFDHLRDIKDPEHPYSLEELKVITEDAIKADDSNSYVRVTFTPTVEHCSMATIIGLCLRVKLMRSLPSQFKDGYFLEAMVRFIDALGYDSVVNPTLECAISTIQKTYGLIKLISGLHPEVMQLKMQVGLSACCLLDYETRMPTASLDKKFLFRKDL